MPPLAVVAPEHIPLQWHEAEPGVWTRDIDEIEEFYAAIAKQWEGSNRMYFALTGHLSLRLTVQQNDRRATERRVDEALGKAWQALRHDHPGIASQTLLDLNTGTFTKMFKTDRFGWFDETFVCVNTRQTGTEWANSDPPAPKLPTLFVLSPKTSGEDQHIRRDIVLRSPHDIMDGIGALLLFDKLLQHVSDAFDQGDSYVVPLSDVHLKERLSPPYRIAAGVPPKPTAAIEKRLQQLASDQDKDAETEQIPMAGLPFKQGETKPQVHKRVELTLTEDETLKLIRASKAVGATVTHVFHAAIALTLRNLQEKTDEARRVQYVNYILRNERKACKPPYNGRQHPASVYHSVSPGKLVVEMNVPSSASDAESNLSADKEEFLRLVRLMTDYYHAVRNDADHYAIAPYLWAKAVPKLPVPLDAANPLPIPPPELHPSVSISSMGKIDDIISPERGSISVSNPWVTGEELRSGLGLFLGSFKGTLSLSAAYNDAWHDEDEINEFLKHCLDVVNLGLEL